MIKFLKYILHPILFAIYSILALYVSNLGEIKFQYIVRPLVLVVILSLVLLVVFQVVLRGWAKSGLMATWSLFLILTYGHVYSLAKGLPWTALIFRHRVLLPIWALLFLSVFILLVKWIKDIGKLPEILNIVMGALVLFSLFILVRHTIAQHIADRSQPALEAPPVSGLTVPQNPPDIYYLLLDGYTRADVLYTKFGFDNREFLESLESLGFYIADCSRSNYEHTHLTLPSLMNMAYIDTLVGEVPQSAKLDSLRFDNLTKNNQVMQSLRRIGYETVAFENSYYWAQFSTADYYFEPAQGSFLTPILSEFEKIFLDTTVVSALQDWGVRRGKQLFEGIVTPTEAHALQTQYTLEKLKELPEMDGPQFVMAHLVVPHPPYVFNPNGVIPNIEDYDESWEEGKLGQSGYLDNIRFINQEILLVVREIIEKSSTPPIIILQADHGSNYFDRTMILSAFHLPGAPSEALYPGITPVNTFRLVFKYIFDAPYELLPDRSFSGQYPPFDFQPIEETYSHCLSAK
jgi:hypothetical protein